MIKTEGTTIKAFRGDRGYICISKTDSEGNIEKFDKGDKVIFSLKNDFSESDVILRKIIDVEEDTNFVKIDFSSQDTLIGDLISEATDYEYDISVNGAHTILGHDDNGAKIFRLYPSGSDDK